MDLNSELRFDADPAAVFAMLTDEAYIEKKTMAANAIRHQVSVHRDGDRVTIDLLRVMPPDVPDFVRRFVGETIDIKQRDTWGPAAANGSREGSIALEMSGAPVKATGSMTLSGNGSASTVLTIKAVLKASVPLVGGKIEQAVHQGLMHAVKVEQRVGNDWLAGTR